MAQFFLQIRIVAAAALIFFSDQTLFISGYGNIAPVTTAGRVFCILYAIVGIPFTLSVIADVGQIFATLISTLWTKYKHLLEPIKEKIIEYKKRNKELQREKARYVCLFNRYFFVLYVCYNN